MQPTYRDLRTERLVLRRPEEGDAAHIFRAFGADPEVTRFLTWRPHHSIADAEAALAQRLKRLSDGSEYSWVVQRAEHCEAIGVVSAWLAGDGAELGFVLARAHWNLGLMTEAVSAVKEWAFADAGAARVWATCDLENLGSARVLDKVGLTELGLCSGEIVRPNISPSPRPSLLFEARAPRTQG
ncbi:MAG: GNAT family N-acetyltransferase [Deltaproteobacteria bacterium]|nr:GNAT family N-acetyltransferase [Nannocystaceae bacterium]